MGVDKSDSNEKELICILCWDIFVYCSATWFAFEKWKCSHLYTLEYSTLFSQVTYTVRSREYTDIALWRRAMVRSCWLAGDDDDDDGGNVRWGIPLSLSLALSLSRLFFTQHLFPSLTICLSPQFAYLFTQTEYSLKLLVEEFENKLNLMYLS